MVKMTDIWPIDCIVRNARIVAEDIPYMTEQASGRSGVISHVRRALPDD
jgi:hypothetical protein